jgi:hypothetical protein
VSWICQLRAPAAANVSRTCSRCGIERRLICVLHERRSLCALKIFIASTAERYDPLTPRRRSCVASSPSSETLPPASPASLAAPIISYVTPRPPVVVVVGMP